MVSMHAPPDRRLELHRAFVDVAVQRRVALVVYLSFVGAGPDASFVHARSHGATETMLAESGLPFTAVLYWLLARGQDLTRERQIAAATNEEELEAVAAPVTV